MTGAPPRPPSSRWWMRLAHSRPEPYDADKLGRLLSRHPTVLYTVYAGDPRDPRVGVVEPKPRPSPPARKRKQKQRR